MSRALARAAPSAQALPLPFEPEADAPRAWPPGTPVLAPRHEAWSSSFGQESVHLAWRAGVIAGPDAPDQADQEPGSVWIRFETWEPDASQPTLGEPERLPSALVLALGQERWPESGQLVWTGAGPKGQRATRALVTGPSGQALALDLPMQEAAHEALTLRPGRYQVIPERGLAPGRRVWWESEQGHARQGVLMRLGPSQALVQGVADQVWSIPRQALRAVEAASAAEGRAQIPVWAPHLNQYVPGTLTRREGPWAWVSLERWPEAPALRVWSGELRLADAAAR